MTALEVFKQVLSTGGCHVAREQKKCPGQYDSKLYFDGNRRGWTMVDLFTASTVCQVHAALKPENQAKFETLPLVRMAEVASTLAK